MKRRDGYALSMNQSNFWHRYRLKMFQLEKYVQRKENKEFK